MPLKIPKPFSIKKPLPVFFFFVFGVMSCVGQNQGINNNWIMGYGAFWGPPWGNTRINFYGGSPAVSFDSLQMQFNHTHSNISDTAGNILFYTNGVYIATSNDATMQNGTGLNPSVYTNSHPDGLGIPQSCLILRMPSSDSLYYLFHSTVDNPPLNTVAKCLYLTKIDMSVNSDLGAVISKNQIVINDTLNAGKIAACMHGNGRDWWIMVHRVNTNMFYKLLLTPSGISGPYTQNIGPLKQWDAGQAWFSPDGKRYAYYYINGGLDIYDFDRCAGNLSNPIHINIPNGGGYNVGMTISPNSNVLYVTNTTSILQYDLTSANIAASEQTVAVYDSFVDPQNLFGTYLCLSALAPDGKIYISTGNSTQFMHVINSPDSLGLVCNVAQHGVFLPTLYYNTLPNHSNYFLGRWIGSPCDTITSWMGLADQPPDKPNAIKVLSNPNDGKFTLWFNVHDKHGWLEIFDINGKLVLREPVAQWSQYKQVDIGHLTPEGGMFFCKMRWGAIEQSVKVIIN